MSVKIDQAFIAAMLDGMLQLDIVHENGGYSTWANAAYTHYVGAYQPNANREYCEIHNFPAGKTAFSLATSDEFVGLFQVILKYPADIGAFTIKQKAEDVLNLLSIGATLTYSGQEVEILSNTRDGGRIEGGFYQIVVRANYRAFTSR